MSELRKVIIFGKNLLAKLETIDHNLIPLILKIHNNKAELPLKYSYIECCNIDPTNSLTYLSSNKEVDFFSGKQLTESEKWISKNRTTVRVGSLFRAILLASDIEFEDYEIEELVNLYRATNINYRFELVKGEDIKYWYLWSNYFGKNNAHSLYNSCMRYKSSQNYLQHYVENPNVSLLVCIDSKTNKLLSRAILWEKTTIAVGEKVFKNVKYLDRIYAFNDGMIDTIKKYAVSKGWFHKKYQGTGNGTIVDGSTKIEYNHAIITHPCVINDLSVKTPYLDTIKFLCENIVKGKLIYNYSNQYEHSNCILELNSTSGSPTKRNSSLKTLVQKIGKIYKISEADLNKVSYITNTEFCIENDNYKIYTPSLIGNLIREEFIKNIKSLHENGLKIKYHSIINFTEFNNLYKKVISDYVNEKYPNEISPNITYLLGYLIHGKGYTIDKIIKKLNIVDDVIKNFKQLATPSYVPYLSYAKILNIVKFSEYGNTYYVIKETNEKVKKRKPNTKIVKKPTKIKASV